MATGRYNSFIYNDGTLYGDSEATGLILWSVEIDWDQDFIFDGSNEASRMFSIVWNRGRKKMLKQPSQQGEKQVGLGFESVAPGRCVIKLWNNDGRYDGWNQDSPLYPYVTYGPDVRIRNVNQATGVWADIFYGTIVDIRSFGYGADAYIEVEIEDGSRFLRTYTARSPIAEDITCAEAINNILDAVNWPSRWGRNIDAGTGIINYHWASGSKLAWSELEDVAQSFLSIFFIAADGKARFVDRESVPSVVLNLTQEEILKDIFNPQPGANRRNIIRLKVHPMAEATADVIYQVVGDPLLIEAGSSKTIWADYTYNNQPVPAKDIIQPVATTDFLAFVNSDGTGTNKTSDCTITVTDFGDNAKMVIRNIGATNFYVTERRIRGTAIYEENSSDVTYPEDISSVRQPREFVLDQRWQQSVNVAFDYSVVLGAFFDMLHPFPVVKIKGHPDIQFVPDLFDVLTLDVNKLGIVGESFRVGGIEGRSIRNNCQDIETKYYLESYLTAGDYWTWPITDFGTDTIFGAG